jgi:transcriptional regulator with XRE-family HTH domain
MAEHYKVELGRRIKTRREELGMTQKDLADATHYKEAQSVSRWERGENVPADLDTVAAALDWTLADLVTGVDPPNRRVARQFGLAAATPDVMSEVSPERLTRIEQKLDRLLLALSPTTREQADQLGQALLEAGEALGQEQPAPAPKRRAQGRRGPSSANES